MMSLQGKLQGIEDKLAAENALMLEARERIKELLPLREEIAFELAHKEQLAEFHRKQEEGRKWREAHPEEHAAFMERIQREHQEFVIEGFLDGWWDLDEHGNMAAPAQVFHISDFAEIKNPLLAHVMAKAGIFPSIGQARKNGWDKPLTTGEWTVTKKKIRIRIEE